MITVGVDRAVTRHRVKESNADGPTTVPGSVRAATPLAKWRSVDWRFYIPGEGFRRVGYVGGVPDEEREALLEAGIEVVDEEQRLAEADVVIVASDLDNPIDALRGLNLGAGTWVLVRMGAVRRRLWARLTRASLRECDRHLRTHGLAVTGAYWHAPDARQCSYIVEIDDRVAVDVMLRRYHGVRLGLPKSIVARAINRAGHVGLIARDVTLVARALGEESAPRCEQASFPGMAWTTPRRRSRGNNPISMLMVTPWFEASRHVICLYVDGITGLTCDVAKMPRRPRDTGGIAHEGRMLLDLADRTNALSGQVPVVKELSLDQRPMLLETSLHGRVAGPELVRNEPREVLAAVFDFVCRLPTTGTSSEDLSWFARLLEEPLRTVAAVVDLEDLAGLVNRTLAMLDPLKTAVVPMVFEHGDLSHPNLLLDAKGRLGAVDWERSEARGLPAHDLCFFLQYASESRRSTFERAGQLRAFNDAFTGPDAWGGTWLRRYASLLGVEERLLPCLVLATWARSSASLLKRLKPSSPAESSGETSVAPTTPGLPAAFATDRDFHLWGHAVDRFEDLLR
jgi:hypothetical protein